MLPYTEHGAGDLTLVLMPFLGGSQREWTETVALLTKHARCVTLDLPGFGEAAKIPGYTVAEMAAALTETLAALSLGRYVLVGHSMAGKLSAVVARQLADAGNPLPPPIALVLVAPSPPGPEPMTEAKRAQMLESLGAPNPPRKQAEAYIRDNSTRPLPKDRLDRTVDDVLKMNPAAWTAWLEGGSKEDWSTTSASYPFQCLYLQPSTTAPSAPPSSANIPSRTSPRAISSPSNAVTSSPSKSPTSWPPSSPTSSKSSKFSADRPVPSPASPTP